MNILLEKEVENLTDSELAQLLTQLNQSYRNGEQLVSDDIFDHVYMPAAEARIPHHPLVQEVQPDNLANSKGLIKHPEKMLSTDKAYTGNALQKWINRAIKKGKELGIKPNDIIIEASSKLDGIAGRYVARTNQLITRGKGDAGYDISHLITHGMKIVGNNNQDGVGEVVMKNEYFKNYSEETVGKENGFIDSRGLIAGAANSDVIKNLALKALNAGHVELVIYNDMNKTTCSADEFMDKYEEMEEIALTSEYMLDGVIFDVTNPEIKKALGSTSHHPVWRIAKKRIKESAPVKPHSIRWQVGRTRIITPVLEIAPTVLSRVTVTSITGHSLGYLKKHGLGVNSTFLAHRSGDVIPSFLESVDKVQPTHPTVCPCCESPTIIKIKKDKDGDDCEHLFCSNDLCEGSSTSYLFHAFKRLNIDLFGKASCAKLIEAGFSTLEKILVMEHQDFTKAGFGQGEATNFLDEIERSKKEELKDSQLLASLGIHLLGRGTSEKLLKAYKITELEGIKYEQLLSINGFAEITAKTVANGLIEKKDTLQFLLSQNFNLTHSSEAEEVTDKDNALAGVHVVFTGTMHQGNRNEMKADAKSKGAVVQSKLNKKSQLLVIGTKAAENKINTAKELNVEVIDEQAYLDRYTTT